MKQNMQTIGINQDVSANQLIAAMSNSKPKIYKLAKTTQVKKDDFQKWFKHYLLKKQSKKKPEHFQNIIKEQHKRMYVSNFIKKLKRIIVPQTQVCHQVLNIHESKQTDGWKGYQMSKNQQLFYYIVSILSSTFLLVLITLSLTFEDVQKSGNFDIFMGINLTIHVLQILKQCLCMKLIISNKITDLKEIIEIYFNRQLVFDALIFLCFILHFAIPKDSISSYIVRIVILFKIKALKNNILNIELNIIDNLYREQLWRLGKMLTINFFFAHFFCLLLILMTKLSPEKNWILDKKLDTIPEIELYIWAYYWAVTTMLSVGYGDFVPVSWQQTVVIIFIQIFSCMFFAYNLHCIGNIIEKINSYDIQTFSNMKTFNHYIQHTQISNQLQCRLRNFIKQSATMKKQTNLEEEKTFLSNLPQSFKTDLLKESNQKVWGQLLFFKNLSQKMVQYLSVKVQKFLSHPQQIIYKKRTQLSTLIFQSGSYSYLYNRPLIFNTLSSNGKQVKKFKLLKGQYKILSLDFIFNKTLNFDVKSTDYTVIYKLSNQHLISCLRNNPYDFEFYCIMKDKDSILLNEYQVQDCQICNKEKHNLFKCPKLHYLPIKQHVTRKYLSENKISSKYQIIVDTYRKNRKYYTCFKDLKDCKQNIIKYRFFLLKKSDGNLQIESITNKLEDSDFDFIKQIQNFHGVSSKNLQIEYDVRKKTITSSKRNILKEDLEQIYKKVLQKPESMWQVQCDSIHNFKYYFKNYNCESLIKKKFFKFQEMNNSKIKVHFV